ncbi:MAG: hypothetical protein IPM32_11820 [Ignavibacteriae bacterium]|nr:hypothetical protein [Ignavibacteriota bacterium]
MKTNKIAGIIFFNGYPNKNSSANLKSTKLKTIITNNGSKYKTENVINTLDFNRLKLSFFCKSKSAPTTKTINRNMLNIFPVLLKLNSEIERLF